MKHFVFALILGMAMVCFSSNIHAQQWVTVTVDFEQFVDGTSLYQIGEDSAWGGRTGGSINSFPAGFGTYLGNVIGPYGETVSQTEFAVNGVTFYYNGASTAWFGTGLSARYTSTPADFTNEMASITGSGYDGSSAYGIIYADSTVNLDWNSPMLPVIKFQPGVELESMMVTNTAYVVNSMTNGDGFATPGGYLDLIIYGIDAHGGCIGYVTQSLGTKDGVLLDWVEVDLSPLSGATELRFAFDSDDILDYSWLEPDWVWYNYPVYVAIDDIKYSYLDDEPPPEPATLDIDGDGKVNDRDANLLLLYVYGFHDNNPGWANNLLAGSQGTRATEKDVLDYLNENLSIFDLDGDGKVNDRDANLLLLYVYGFHESNPGWANNLLSGAPGTRSEVEVVTYIESHLP